MAQAQRSDRPNRDEMSERLTEHPPVVPTQKARQAVTGHNVRYVLGFALAAIVLAFIVIYLVYFV